MAREVENHDFRPKITQKHSNVSNLFTRSAYSVSYEKNLVVFPAVKFLTVWPDIGVLEIVESIYLLEIVEFVEIVEFYGNCGIV